MARSLGISERRLLGWEPSETSATVHGVTTTTREPEWDDFERDKMLALELYEAELCECGFHKSLAHDPDEWFDPVSVKCPVCAGAAVLERRVAAENDREEKAFKDKPGVERASDGVRWFVKWRTR